MFADIARPVLLEDDDLVRMGEVEHHPGPLFEHVGIEIIGTQQRHAGIEFIAFGPDRGMQCAGLFDLRAELQQREQPAISLDHMVGEIGKQQRADDGPQGASGANAYFVEYSHDDTESQAESQRQL